MKKKTTILMSKSIFSSILLIGASACGVSVKISDARIEYEDEENYYIGLEINEDELRNLYEENLYFFVRVFPCGKSSQYYPATPLINGRPVTSEMVRHQSDLDLSARVPKRLMSNADKYCLSLNGTTYLETRNFKTNIVEIAERDYQSNN